MGWCFSQNHGEAKRQACCCQGQGGAGPPIVLSRQIMKFAKIDEITVKEIEDSTGANCNTIKVHVKKLAADHCLTQVGKGRGAR